MEALSLTFVYPGVFLVLERVFPVRALPHSPGWYLRAVFLNAAQLGVMQGGYAAVIALARSE